MMYLRSQREEEGFALLFTLMILAVMLSLVGAYSAISRIELATTGSSGQAINGFYGAEAGLNLRAQTVRDTFVDYNVPSGSAPSSTSPCTGANMGSGDFACQNYTFGAQTIRTYLREEPGNPLSITIPLGERYQGLSADEYQYTALSSSFARDGMNSATLELRFKSRLVPLFQFAAFYDKDLEILPGPAMTFSGPVHTNGDLYLNAETSLAIQGQVTTAGNFYRGRKNDASCRATPVSVIDPTNPRNILPSCSARTMLTPAAVVPWNGQIQMNVQQVSVPPPESFTRSPGELYWDKADLRLVLRLNSSENRNTTFSDRGVEVRNANDSINQALTDKMDDFCRGSIGESSAGANDGRIADYNSAMYNYREAQWLRIMDVDVRALLNCIHSQGLFGAGKTLADTTQGGIVLFFSVDGPNSGGFNRYGVRLRNGSRLQATVAGAPAIVEGITVVVDQALYVRGDYNSTNKLPAALMADSMNVLSNSWNDANSNQALGNRVASNTTINAAFLSGSDTTGGSEGTPGQGGAYNGGLENYPRFHENWTDRRLTYRGSLVSLQRPQHVRGAWSAQSYNPPIRDWNYDTSFNNAANLPPITPRFVYLRQQLFMRDYGGVS